MPLRLSWGALLLSIGCSSLVTPDLDRLGAGSDGGPGLDASVNEDGGPPARLDAGVADAGPLDAHAGCAGPDRCEGEVLVTCRAGVEERQPCAERDAFCAVDRCQSWVCRPGSRECSADGRGVVGCSARGDSESTMPCDLGCDAETRTCTTLSPACTGLPRIAVGGTSTFDLCRETHHSTHTPGEGCPSTREARVGDRTFLLLLESATDVTIELTDVDSSAAIDTIVYVRRVCDDASSQLVCNDDVSCASSTVPGPGGCSGSVDVRQSRIRARLEAGAYFIVADAFTYFAGGTTYRCGQVRLTVSGG